MWQAELLNSVFGTLSSGVAASTSSYESIASATGSGSTVITFSSIPSTYSHLQLRCIYKTTGTTANWVYATITLNNDATNNYTEHVLSGDGTSVTSTGTASSGGARPQVYGYTSAAAFVYP